MLLLLAGVALAGCGPVESARPAAAAPVPVPVPGRVHPAPVVVGAVQGRGANALIAQFGQPQIDLREGEARKLQFAGPDCVLDAYLYPAARGRDSVVRHVDTRQRSGAPIDEASCVAALTRRP